VAVRSAFIVGFPGETEEHFQELREFVEEVSLDRLFVFTFSPEEGTQAFGMEDQVPEETAEERRHTLMGLQARISFEANARKAGSRTVILCESIEGAGPDGRSVIVGRTACDAPEVDLSVRAVGAIARPGQFQKVKITRAFEYELVGVAIGKPW
jgi:ribosomal protein S12 methylthiotransferase